MTINISGALIALYLFVVIMVGNIPCLYSSLNKTHVDVISLVKLAFACLGILTSIIAAVILVQKCGLLVYKIVFYATVMHGLRATVRMMEYFPVDYKHNANFSSLIISTGAKWVSFCEVLGFLDQTTAWMAHLCMAWVIVYLLHLLVKEKRLEEGHCSKNEIVGVAVCLLAPFTFNWIPFLHGYYGFTGSWCWIKLTGSDDDGNCSNNEGSAYNSSITEGLAYSIILYYGPLLLFVLFNIFSGLFIVLRYLQSPKYQSHKFSFVLVFYILTYGILCIGDFATYIVTIKAHINKTQSLSPWIAEATVNCLQTTIPSSVVIFTFCRRPVRKKRYRRMQQK